MTKRSSDDKSLLLRDWGPPHDQPRTANERKAVADETAAILDRYPGVMLVEAGIERRAGRLDGDGHPMDDIPVVYVTFPGGMRSVRCTRGDVASFHNKADRETWDQWQSGRSTLAVRPFYTKPLKVEAFRHDGTQASADFLKRWAYRVVQIEERLYINLIGGPAPIKTGQWIVKDEDGDFGLYNPDEFTSIYEERA